MQKTENQKDYPEIKRIKLTSYANPSKLRSIGHVIPWKKVRKTLGKEFLGVVGNKV